LVAVGRAPGPGAALVQDGDVFRRFEAPERVVQAFAPGEVRGALDEVEAATRRGGWAAGFLCYEAAAAFGLAVRAPHDGLPLLWFGLYAGAAESPAPPAAEGPPGAAPADGFVPTLDAAAHARALAALQEHIARGDTYQVNFTFPLRARFRGEPWTSFRALRQVQQAGHAAYVDTGRFVVCSASPELFFRREGERLTARPMKGTARRGRTPAEDGARARALRASEKERAENLMIVDMLRNDLGRVAATGSVAVRDLFRVERYPTLLQMTSTVCARTTLDTADVFAALFPCASVTGAPKVRTMQIIAEAESGPRGVYTGAVGWMGPGRRASFAVAIRTLVVDRERGEAVYGVGSGVVADSSPEREYDECLLKARVLGERPFRLLETLRFTPGEGYFLEEAHLGRLMDSAAHFGAAARRTRLSEALGALARRLRGPSRVRLLVDLDGNVEVEAADLDPAPARPACVALSPEPVDDQSPWLFHKTTRREVYDAAQAARPDADDVVLWNRRGEVTEACRHNLVVDLGDGPVTPPVSCGLLDGTFRGHLLATGQVRERVVTLPELRAARSFFLVNSVTGWRAARWAEEARG
jgi:para-aminobenzoate synthetase/4-amino-4-deoxychorismate lyase